MSWIRSFGRLKGRGFTQEKIQDLESFLIDPEQFNFSGSVSLEIGFGYGEHLAAQANANPYNIYIGAEVYQNGLGSMIKKIKEYNLKNILLWNQDARILLEKIPNNALERVFLLFPDPWPKKKHLKRRIINQKFLSLVANKISSIGEFIVATDIEEYAEYIKIEAQKIFSSVENFTNDSIVTRYRQKANSKIYIYRISNAYSSTT